MRDGKVSVCEMVSEIPKRASNHVVAPTKAPRVICSLDENSAMDAFAMVLAHRIKRHEHDFMKLVKARQDRIRAEIQAENELRRKDLRAELMKRLIRGRVIFSGIGR
jgi:hypothetical protein